MSLEPVTPTFQSASPVGKPAVPKKSLLARAGLLMALLGTAAGSARVLGQGTSGDRPGETVADYRQFAMQHEGDETRGGRLFSDERRVACAKCHSTDGRGTKAGPDLWAVGEQFSRRELIDAVLQPSATIAVGYSTTRVETHAGEEFEGVLKRVSDAGIELMGGDGQLVRVAAGDIQEQRGSALSLMPEGLQAGLSRQEFADLIEYLVSRKEPASSLSSHQGMPETIPWLAHPAELRPMLRTALRGPPASGGAGGQGELGLVWFGQVPGLPGRFLAVHQAGVIWLVDEAAGGEAPAVFADLTAEVFSTRGPNGLLGLAFHPRFRENRKYYLKHQVFEGNRIVTVVVERMAGPDGRRDAGRSSRRLLEIAAVAEHHNGGCLVFGPDGFLYVGMGDSAPNFDPQGHGQDLRRLVGKMLRLDVDRRDPGLGYAIPADNPFRGRADARAEIWAYGLREPWRFSFDPGTGDLWVADLGQERGDEVTIVRRGENHGWNVYEGFELFAREQRRPDTAYVAPIFALRRKHGSAVMGGHVYRGDRHPSFRGVYVFGDYQSKRIWGLRQDNRTLQTIRQLAAAPQAITCFGTDEQGELYVVGYQGMIYRLDLTGACFDEAVPAAGR